MSNEKYVSEAEIRRRAEKNLEYWPTQEEKELLAKLQSLESRVAPFAGGGPPSDFSKGWKKRALNELANLAEEIL